MMHLDLTPTESHLMKAAQVDSRIEIGIAAKNCNTGNYSDPFGKIRKNEQMLLHAETGIQPGGIFFLNQVHEDTILQLDTLCDTKLPFVGDGDAMITDRRQFCLVIRTADCIPVMLFDPAHNCIGAIHSGWRSTELDICGKTVDALQKRFQSKPEELFIYILPGIGQKSYQVSQDVAEKFPHHYVQDGETYKLSLNSAIIDSLVKKGCNPQKIFASFYDTFEHNDLFFSHRKGDKGRNLNYIYLK